MNSTTFSILVRCWYDMKADATRLKVVRTDTTEDVRLKDGYFSFRIEANEATSNRCFIRHLASGREAYVQGGPNLYGFIKDCLLKDGEPGYSDPGPIDGDETTL